MRHDLIPLDDSVSLHLDLSLWFTFALFFILIKPSSPVASTWFGAARALLPLRASLAFPFTLIANYVRHNRRNTVMETSTSIFLSFSTLSGKARRTSRELRYYRFYHPSLRRRPSIVERYCYWDASGFLFFFFFVYRLRFCQLRDYYLREEK